MRSIQHILINRKPRMSASRTDNGHSRNLLFSIRYVITIVLLFLFMNSELSVAQKRIYIANDDHTDYMWKGDEEEYRQAFVEMIDYYLDLADATANDPQPYQSRFNCDGSFWMWTYEKNKSRQDFERFIDHIKSGHISVPLTALVSCYGGVPAEAVLRGMYYAGKIERKYDLRFPLAVAMENQTLPYGLGSLWAGAGATYSWRGICGCVSQVPDAWDREHDIYWWVGPDGSRILMKWNSMITHTASEIGGYAEAMGADDVITFVDTNSEFRSRYPYDIIGAFGYGGDMLKSTTEVFVDMAREYSNAQRQIIVSNEQDFFQDFEANYGQQLPQQSCTFGNEWDLYCASMAEVSARVKRALEKLRAAEAMATIVSLKNPYFMQGRESARDNAWMDFGLYWEHDWTADGRISRERRAQWQRKIASGIEQYVNSLFDDAVNELGKMIRKSGNTQRFFVFNPLGWERTDIADFAASNLQPFHVVDISTDSEVPSQIVEKNGQPFVRIYAQNVPAVGYRVYEIRSGAGHGFEDAGTVNGRIMENAYYKLTLADRGAIVSLIDKSRGNREFVRSIDGRAMNDLGAGPGSLHIESIGPVSLTVKATGDAPLAHESSITLIRDSRRIEIENEITQNFSDVYTWGFGFNLNNPEVWHEEVGAIIRAKLLTKGGHYSPRNARYDWMTLNHFADMSDGQVGVTLSNADAYFFKLGRSTVDMLDDETPLISPLVGGQVDGPHLGIPDQGGDEYFRQRFALTTHDQYDQTSAMRFALEHQNPLVTGPVFGGTDMPESSYSFLSIEPNNVLLWALKPADDGPDAGIVVRLWNTDPDKTTFTLRPMDHSLISAQQLTHIETPIRDMAVDNMTLRADIRGNQIETFAITPDGISLPVKIDGFSGSMQNDRVILQWHPISNLTNVRYYVQRRSLNDSDYVTIATMEPAQAQAELCYEDYELPAGTLHYRLKEVHASGSVRYSNEIVIKVSAPHQFELRQNYPNPFNPSTKVSFDLPEATTDSIASERTTLIIYDLSGRQIRTLVNDQYHPGHYTVEWNGKDENGQKVSSGLYLYVLKYGTLQKSRQMILLR